MRLQKATVFGLYAVLELAAAPDRQLTVTEIADKYGISAHHLAKVLRDLGRAGLVDSVRGAGGGYRFVGDARRLTLMDVIRLFEDVEADADDQPQAGPGIAEGLRFVLAEVDSHTVPTLQSISLATMLKLVARRPWVNGSSGR
ncbi:Rrf2 family transcriptional regulator [Rhodopila globiformis]|uniref:Transcriptional regulator n=1 Tax=Rhodopila globiformis TaxID=1071 RepID=A0A2S6MW16_RHOGL|nr:Rrf2 family transcriptional regulator [Rhodopila globiformis]PPQ26565.1 transcriptional regulator [Rhodopila globiformis]